MGEGIRGYLLASSKYAEGPGREAGAFERTGAVDGGGEVRG